MSAVTIPKEMHERMVHAFKIEYEDEFGNMEATKTFSRDELIVKYAADIAFWKKREPSINLSKKPSMRIICAHAITTNAQSAMWRLCDEKNIKAEVESRLESTTSTPTE